MKIRAYADRFPKEFEFTHNYLCFLNDSLAELMTVFGNRKVFRYEISLDGIPNADEFHKLNSDQIIYWLYKNGPRSGCVLHLKAMMLTALLPTFHEYMFEGLECSRRGHVSVAYSVFRKPFQDILFYLEFLLAEPEELLVSYMDDVWPSKLDVARKSEDTRRRLIAKAITMTANPALYHAETIYNVRYDRKLAYSLSGLWDKSLHLITTYNYIKTNPQDFNFVSLRDDDLHELLRFMYFRIPVLFNYTIEVVQSVLADISPESHFHIKKYETKRLYGLQFSSDCLKGSKSSTPLPCPRCKREFIFGKESLLQYMYSDEISCTKCGYTEVVLETPEGTKSTVKVAGRRRAGPLKLFGGRRMPKRRVRPKTSRHIN